MKTLLLSAAIVLNAFYAGARPAAADPGKAAALNKQPEVHAAAAPASWVVGGLIGTWAVVCPNGHVDMVDGITRNHDCEKCGVQAVSDGFANVVCPVGHVSSVNGVTQLHVCPVPNCGRECRR